MVKYSARGYSAKKWHDLESWKQEKYQDMGLSGTMIRDTLITVLRSF